MNEITNIGELTPEVQQALACHQRIVESGRTASSALIEMGKGLKRMRDGKLYTALGYESFGQYVEHNGDYSFKERQAYTYIKAVESFGEEFLTEHGDLGITKLGLLTALSEQDAVEVIEGSDISGMTADEVKALVREKQALGEQLSFWKEEARSAKDGSADAEAELQRLREDMKAAEQKIESYEEAKRKSALDAEKAEKKLEKLKAKHKQELDKLNAEIEMVKSEQAGAAEPTEEQRKAIAAEYETQIEELKKNAQAAEEEKKALEKKLKSGTVDEMKAAMRVYFSETQKAINGFIEKLAEIPDPQTRTTYQFGTVRWLKGVIEDLEELEE